MIWSVSMASSTTSYLIDMKNSNGGIESSRLEESQAFKNDRDSTSFSPQTCSVNRMRLLGNCWMDQNWVENMRILIVVQV
jgi:hypothetical protein